MIHFFIFKGQSAVAERLTILEQQVGIQNRIFENKSKEQNDIIHDLNNKVKAQNHVIDDLNSKLKDQDAAMADLHSKSKSYFLIQHMI